ncbi:MAG: hypothetical protein AAF500_05860 [Myxococcota bacterium]
MIPTASSNRSRLANQIAVVFLGMYTGVMVAIGLGFGRYWLSLSSADFVRWFTANFWFLLPTIAATLPLALVGSLWSLRLSQGGPQHGRWRIVVALLVATLLVTVGYHLPANVRLGSGELGGPGVHTELVRWLWAHALRVGLAFAATWISHRASLEPQDGEAEQASMKRVRARL